MSGPEIVSGVAGKLRSSAFGNFPSISPRLELNLSPALDLSNKRTGGRYCEYSISVRGHKAHGYAHPPSRRPGVVALGFGRRCHFGSDPRYPFFNLSGFPSTHRRRLFAEPQRVGSRTGGSCTTVRYLHRLPTAAVAANPAETGRARTSLSIDYRKCRRHDCGDRPQRTAPLQQSRISENSRLWSRRTSGNFFHGSDSSR